MQKKPRLGRAVAVVAGTLLAIMLGAIPANAWTKNDCNVGSGSNGSVCYFYNSYLGGSQEGVSGADQNLSSPAIYFQYTNSNSGSDNGMGDPLWNDAGSAANQRTDCKVHIFTGKDYMGLEVTMSAYPNSGWFSSTLGVANNANMSQFFC